MACRRAASRLSVREMSLTATARSIPGTLRQEVVIDGQHRLITDEPERLGGDGSGPAPHELFPAALAACVSTTLVMYARTKGWELGERDGRGRLRQPLDAAQVRRRDRARRRPRREEQLERLEQVARSCPLRRSIEAGIEFVERIERRRAPSRASGSWQQEVHREQEADRDPWRRDGRHDDRQPAAPPLRP